jgi:hypothetical protein
MRGAGSPRVVRAVTTVTKRLQIAASVIAALIEGQNVMHFISRNQFAVQKALLTKRMLRNVQVAYRVPAAAIKFVRVGGAGLVILAAGSGFVGSAIAAFADGGWAARVSAGVQGAVGHDEAPFNAENSEFL